MSNERKTSEEFYEKSYLNAFFIAPTLALAVIFYMLMTAAMGSDKVNYSFDQNIAIMEDFKEAQKKADLSVVVLGNSRLRNGIVHGRDPSELVTLPDGRNLAIIQYAENAGMYKHFEYLEGYILEARPDYLIIVNTVISNSIASTNLAIYYSQLISDYIGNMFITRDLEKIWYEKRFLPEEKCYEDFTSSMMKTRIETTEKRDNHNLDPAINSGITKARDFIKRALDSGIKVIVLDIPPNLEIMKKFDVDRYILDFNGLKGTPTREELLPDTYNRVIWWDYHDNGGQKHYCDFVHFNETGRNLMSDWFLNELQGIR